MGGASISDDSLAKKAHGEVDARVDMTAMIDLVFMMNIFFLVTSLVSNMGEVDLPAAKHVSAADTDNSVIFTIVATADRGASLLYVGDGASNAPVNVSELESTIEKTVKAGRDEGKKSVIIKAEKRVTLKELAKVAGAASIEDTSIHLAVMEKDD